MNTSAAVTAAPVSVGHIVKGEYISGGAQVYGRPGAQFSTPKLHLH